GLLDSPQLPRIIAELSEVLTAERQRREKFYDEVTEDRKIEFIHGQVIMHSPARHSHIQASDNLLMLLKTFVSLHDLGEVHHEKCLVVFPRNDYEPDLCYFSKAKAAAFTAALMKFPPPDFVVEVLSPTTEGNDRGVKFEDYAAGGVTEYWLVDPDARRVEKHLNRGGEFGPAEIAQSGAEIASAAVLGVRIPVDAIFDRAANLAALRRLHSASA
ncbi:MAG: Uma2 family endonuclease, partial [Opitutaceae bacterium]